MGQHARQVVDGRKVGRVETLDVVQARPKARHPLADGLVEPSPRTDHDEVRPVAHHRPGLEQRLEVLARLDRADEEDEARGQLQPLAGGRQVIAAHRREARGNAVRHDLDARPGDAKNLDDVVRGVL